MRSFYLLICVFYFYYLLTDEIMAQFSYAKEPENDTGVIVIENTNAYCFEFTWLGPDFDNTTEVRNTTCKEIKDNTRAFNVPCREPLVISHNGQPPLMNYIWENHKGRVACRRNDGQVCARYTYFYNQEVQNITYLCTKVLAISEGPVLSGCYTQMVDGEEVELCVCESEKGHIPCNLGVTHHLQLILLLFTPFMIIIGKFVNN